MTGWLLTVVGGSSAGGGRGIFRAFAFFLMFCMVYPVLIYNFETFYTSQCGKDMIIFIYKTIVFIFYFYFFYKSLIINR